MTGPVLLQRAVAYLAAGILCVTAGCTVAPLATPDGSPGATAPATSARPTPAPPTLAPTPALLPVAAMPGPLEIGPDGAIVFLRTDDAREVDTQFIVNPDGTNERQLSPRIVDGVWSPDGEWLAFQWGDWDSGTVRPAVMRADGSGFRVLDPDPGRAIRLTPRAWTVDGKRLIVATGGKDDTKAEDVGLWSIRVADGGDLRRLAPAVEPADVGEFLIPSPDGTRVLHNRINDRDDRPDQNDLSVENINGTDEIRLSPEDPNITLIDLEFYDGTSEDWSPDSKWIAFCVALIDAGQPAMYVVRADGRGLAQIVPPEIGAISAQWSPDGTWIAFTSETEAEHHIWVVRSDGTGRRQLTDDSGGWDSMLPIWSPDGAALVFQRKHQRPGPVTMWTIGLDGSDLRQLTPTPLANDLTGPDKANIFGWVGGYAWWRAPRS